MVPRGLILLWYGAIANIPAGYVLCDGNNGTPDLRDKFVIGAGGLYPVDATGGNGEHNHTFTGDGHTHTFPAGEDIGSGAVFGDVTGEKAATGTTNNSNHMPPYHALAYIMKT